LHRLEAVFDRRCQEFVERRSKTASKRLEKLIFNCAQASINSSLTKSLTRWNTKSSGFSKYDTLNQWVGGGIADHIGRDKFDFDEMLENYRNNLPMMDYEQSGLYLEYQLLVEYMFKYKAANAESLLEENPSETEVKNEMQNLTK
jgi:hypothetical protein